MPTPTKNLTTLARNLRKHDTWAEKLMWSWLRGKRFSTYKFRRQHTFGPYILDFFCVEAFLNIELDGSQHGFPEGSQKDTKRDAWLAKAGVKVLRFWNSRLRREKDSIRATIWRELQERSAHPLPDYCRPMISNEQDSENMAITSPSPRPSPLGRGSIAASLTRKLATGFTGRASEESESVNSYSLSPRERVRVRGNETFKQPAMPTPTKITQ